MKKIKVVFLGSRPLGCKALDVLLSESNVEVVACVTKEKSDSAWWNQDPHTKYLDIPRVELDDLENIEFDFGVSINYWKIIPASIINKPKLGFINLHHSYNLYYRGRDMASHAIQNARKSNIWIHGSCLHYTDDGLDTGPLIASSHCLIDDRDTAWDLFNKVEKSGQKLIEEWIPLLLKFKVPTATPSTDNPLHFRKEIKKELNQNELSPLELFDSVRSLDFNNLFEPAYILSNGIKQYLTTVSEFGSEVLCSAGSNRNVYINTSYMSN